MSTLYTVESFNRNELRKQLNEIIFRGRSRPGLKELLDSLHEEPYCPIPSDEGKGEQLIGTADLEWRKVTLRVHDTADTSQTAIVLIVAKERCPERKTEVSNEREHEHDKFPAVVVLHGTNASASTRRQLMFLTHLARRGMIAIGMDARYHGSRQRGSNTPLTDAGSAYFDALVRAWRADLAKSERVHPFLYDTAADLQSVADYLTSRADVDPDCIGLTGVSLGGMHAWFGAAADERWSAIAPLIGVQSFRYALENNAFHARVASLQTLFDAAAVDLARPGMPTVIDAAVVAKVWDRICPRLTDGLDAVALALLCPRYVFVGSGADDPRCPLPGVRLLEEEARRACWHKCGFNDRFIVKIYDNVAHYVTDEMWSDCVEFFVNAFHGLRSFSNEQVHC